MKKPAELYDRDDYYARDGRASRLSPVLNGLLLALEWLRALAVAARTDFLRRSGPRRLLDVGAGNGAFAHCMQRLGFQPFGTTASQVARQAARDRYGIDLCYATEIPESLRGRRYELITYWHVFEHLEDPVAHVAAWHDLLADDGVVVVEVPNVESLGARLSFSAWLGSDPKHHINPMSERELRQLFAAHRLEVARREGFSLKFTYPFLWSGLLGACFGRAYDFDAVFATLKAPLRALREAPLRTANALAAILYLAPAIVPLAAIGLVTGRGEVCRLYLRKARGTPAPAGR